MNFTQPLMRLGYTPDFKMSNELFVTCPRNGRVGILVIEAITLTTRQAVAEPVCASTLS